jgi:phosphoadenosine phosphosulfate reductase
MHEDRPILDVERTGERLAAMAPEDVLRWTAETFGPEVAASSSFQTQSVPLLHMISRACPHLPVMFLDTGFHFPETIAFRDRLVGELGLNLQVLHCRIPRDAFMRCYGTLYRSDPDLCCYLNKVEPLARALAGKAAWVAGIRRDQTAARRATRILERGGDGIYKVSPLAAWASEDVIAYIRRHGLPVHPLTGQGYPSIGCKPCTRAVGPAVDSRAGRWAESEKTECGIHEDFWRTQGGRGPAT